MPLHTPPPAPGERTPAEVIALIKGATDRLLDAEPASKQYRVLYEYRDALLSELYAAREEMPTA